ncbi:hypothetical protein PAMP_004492 [Pampus punctatissimus]
MDIFRDFFEKEEHKNWLKGVVSLACLQKLLENFIDKEMADFYQEMRKKCGSVCCANNCNFTNWRPTHNQPIPPLDCEVCCKWRHEIWTSHSSQRGKVMWKNSKPHLWSQHKWEVAKVYMTDGHKNHKSIGDFDIAALLSLMTQCKHFKRFELGGLCEQVAYVRNNIMHSANFKLKREDLHRYLSQITNLGEALTKHHPDFRNLSQDINKIQNHNFRLTPSAFTIKDRYRMPWVKSFEELPSHPGIIPMIDERQQIWNYRFGRDFIDDGIFEPRLFWKFPTAL